MSRRIVLIDGNEPAGLLIERGVVVRITATDAIRRVDEGCFSD